MVELQINAEFPVWGLLPKKETGVVNFLSKYPSFDGRSTVIAIFDSGIDPGAPGLQKTSDGKIKVVERFDCSGAGDVNTKTTVTPVDGVITSLTGKRLKIPSTWKNRDSVYRIGVKNAYDLYPDKLKERMKHEYKKKYWDDPHRKAVSDVCREITKFEASHNMSGTLNEEESSVLANLEAKQDFLTSIDKKFSDVGPMYDCVLFHDGDKWVCCIDTTDDGDLSKCKLIGEYSVTHEYCPLTPADQLNFSMNVHENGDILELVGVCSSHGTHVASIAAGYFADSPEQNGVAPGAQIISLTIGDGRLGSMETGTALIRAMIKITELKKKMDIDVINMSYGEHAHWVDAGRIGDFVNEIVNKYGVIWVSSAGNNGPALGTISTPSDINNEPIISVGAYVSADMMVAEYSMRQTCAGTPYTWSSRGPTIDGGIGVHICAPGGAITSVPNCTLKYSQLMNGTSMASPHAAGVVSLLVSAMKQRNLPYSPYSVRRALGNTGSHILGVEMPAQGDGLIQVEKAYDHLLNYSGEPDRDIRFQVTCGPNNSKGIYIRSKMHATQHSFKVQVEPFFLDADNVEADKKIYYNQKFVLTCCSTYVVYPTHLDLSYGSRMFEINIDTSTLSLGLHCTYLMGFDVKCIEKGPAFKVPILIIQPKEVTEPKYLLPYSKINFKPNTIKRHYYVVPNKATWATLKLTSDEDSGRYIIHTIQNVPRQHCKALETNKAIAVTSKADSYVSFPVQEDLVLEIVIAKSWASFGEANLDYSISFHGVKPNQPAITMHAADGIHTVDVKTLQGEEISPSINLKFSVQILRPSEAKIAPLTSRDIIPPNRQIYEIVLTYNFSLTKQCEVSPNLALLSDMLYESEYESQLWMLYDSNKQFLGCGDAYPSKYSVKLEKGDYSIRVQVRHDKKDYLEKVNDASLLLNQKLSSSVTMDVYPSYSQALVGGKKTGVAGNSNPYIPIPLYIAPLAADKFQVKANNAAHYLTGTITYAKDELGKKAAVYPFKYILEVASPKKSTSNTNNSSNNNEKTKLDECIEAIRDARTMWLAKMDAATAETMYEDLLKLYPDHLVIHSAYLQVLDPLDKRSIPNPKKPIPSADTLTKVIGICNKLLESINEESVLAYMATKTDLSSDANKIKITMEQHKNLYIEGLSRKGVALCRLQAFKNEDHKAEIAEIHRSIMKFIDPNEAKILTSHVLYFAIWHSYVNEHYGKVLKFTQRLYEDKPSQELDREFIDCCTSLNWDYAAQHMLRNLPSKYPPAFRPF